MSETKVYPKFAYNQKTGEAKRFESAEDFHEAQSRDGNVWFDNPEFVKEKNGVRQTAKQVAMDKAAADVEAAEAKAAAKAAAQPPTPPAPPTPATK